MSLSQVIAEPERREALSVEDLAMLILKELASYSGKRQDMRLHRKNFANGLRGQVPDEFLNTIMEAWMWLEREALIAPEFYADRDLVFVTASGKRLAAATDTASYIRGRLLPTESLHASLPKSVRSAYLRGEYDVAVFQAFKQVEVAVREASGAADEKIGVALMRDAFKPTTGPLSDNTTLEAEQLSVASLFAGAIGLFKNPNSHRDVELRDPTEAAEMITIASHLLRIVDTRRDSKR